ncbi:unnamed protein product [Discosporangium mesarthrocarpum]
MPTSAATALATTLALLWSCDGYVAFNGQSRRTRNRDTLNFNTAKDSSSRCAPSLKELRQMTWKEVEAHINEEIGQKGHCAAVVPLGATEQHGPTGLIGTDHMTAEAVARGVAAETGAVLAPFMPLGMSVHHSSFPGTVTLSPATFVSVVLDYASSLSRSGFTHVLFINGHGGNVGPTLKAFSDYRAMSGGASSDGIARRSDPALQAKLRLVSWYSGAEVSSLAKELYGDELGQHATPDEVAITQHLFPGSIKTGVELDPDAVQVSRRLGGMTKRVLDSVTGLHVMDASSFRERFPDGRMGSNPALATPEHGQILLELAVRDCTKFLRDFVAEDGGQEGGVSRRGRGRGEEARGAGKEAARWVRKSRRANRKDWQPSSSQDAEGGVAAGDAPVGRKGGSLNNTVAPPGAAGRLSARGGNVVTSTAEAA